MIRYIRLPFSFDAPQMQREVHAIAGRWISHFNREVYEGGWTGIPLRSPEGEKDTIYTVTKPSQQFRDTEYLAQSPYLKALLGQFRCDIKTARLLKLAKGAVIKEHRDVGLNFERGEARMHVPIVTHPDLEFFLDGDRLHLAEGECWYINANLPHRVNNPTNVDRIHLVFDCVVNDWLIHLFSKPQGVRPVIISVPPVQTASRGQPSDRGSRRRPKKEAREGHNRRKVSGRPARDADSTPRRSRHSGAPAGGKTKPRG
jgi:mannose-6-phosphate isomerase-like protein (cupin superfamily)